MIITRTPYRVSFFGGGSDFPEHYEKYGGAVLSSTINRYSYLHCRILPPFFDHRYRIRYFQTERVGRLEDIQHPSVRECLRFLKYPHPLEILHSGDIPAMSGIGSSSAFTVGLLMALHGLMDHMVTKRELAEQAISVEQNWIGENVGSQDQYAAAFGGFNRIDFGPGRSVRVNPVMVRPEKNDYLQSCLLFCFSGIARFSSDIQFEQAGRLKENRGALNDMAALVDEAQGILNGPEAGLDDFGRLLHTAWEIKRRLSPRVSSPTIDDLYDTARRAGALGGKICGAGGGGFLIFFVPPDKRPAVLAALKRCLIVPIYFENIGAHVIFFSHEEEHLPLSGPKPFFPV